MRKLRERLSGFWESKGIQKVLTILYYIAIVVMTFKHSNATTVRITQKITSVTVKVWQAG